METFLVFAGLAAGGWVAVKYAQFQKEEAAKGADKIVCPHCQVRGEVTATSTVRGQGISGGKATAGLLTGGASLLVAGLSKNQRMRLLRCGNCGSEWAVS